MFFNAHKKDREGLVDLGMMTYLPPFVQTVAEMVADMSSAFPIFLTCIEKHG